MEYDRALYRVYERIMEDLNSSPSPLALRDSSASAVVANAASASAAASGLRRRHRRGRDALDTANSTAGVNNDSDLNDLESRGRDEGDDAGSPGNAAADGVDDRERERGRRARWQRRRYRMPVLAGRQLPATAMQRHRAWRREPLPFILPIWVARRLEQMDQPSPTALPDSNDGFSHIFIARLCGGVRARALWRGGNDARHASYDSVAMSPSQQPRTLPAPSLSITVNPRPLLLPPGGGRSNVSDYSESQTVLEGGEESLSEPSQLNAGYESPPSNGSSSGEGLRRRSPIRRSGRSSFPHGTPPRLPPDPSIPRTLVRIDATLRPRVRAHLPLSPPSSAALSSRGSFVSRGEDSALSATADDIASTMSPAQRAIRMQLRQNERISFQGRGRQWGERRLPFSRSSDESDDLENGTSSEDEDSDIDDATSDGDDNDDDRRDADNASEGCSQNSLYRVMHLSFAVAIFHVFVLVSLHVTYIGPRAFRRQEALLANLSMAERVKRQLSRYVLGGEEEHHDNEKKDVATLQPHLINCISYALSTRPAEERSSYFGERDKAMSSDGNGGGDGGGSARKRILVEKKERGGGDAVASSIIELKKDSEHNESHSRDGLPRFGGVSVEFSVESSVSADDDIYEKYIHRQRAIPESGGGKSGMASLVSKGGNVDGVPLLGKDEVLQVKILYGGKCIGRCSRVRKVNYPEKDVGENSTKKEGGSDDRSRARVVRHGGQQRQLLRKQARRWAAEGEEGGVNGENQDDLISPSYWEKVHYRFAIDDALLYLDEKSASLHNITVVNVTVTERCLSTGSDDGRLTLMTAVGQFLSQIYGMDSVIINQLMYGIRGGADGTSFTSGHIKSMQTQERWGWSEDQLETFERHSFREWLLRKFGVIMMSSLAFFLITSVTSLIVRVLTSSGVVLMFPLFECFRAAGMHGADERVLSLSYPWIGAARAAIARGNVHPPSHLVWAHVTKIVLYYVMYEACQAAWSMVLYAKSIPEALPVWIYGFAMIWEYFSMVFVRSALSIHFFPRVVFLYFFVYHVYFYSVPYGYFDVALIPLFLLVLHAMLYTMLALEAPNAARGIVTVECPREVYVGLSWREPAAALPHEWTMFLPLNSRVSPLHDQEVPYNGAPNDVVTIRGDENAGSDDNINQRDENASSDDSDTTAV